MTEQDPLAHRRALLARIQTEGADAAYQALLGVCRDPKAPAPAKATSGTTLFRAGGLLDAKQAGTIKPPEEMSAAEIAARIEELSAKRADLAAGLETADVANEDDDAEDQQEDSSGRDNEKPNDLFG